MILYQLAKWMEERMKLVLRIRESKGSIEHLLEQKRQVEQRMLVQTRRWLEPGDLGMLAEKAPVQAEVIPFTPAEEAFEPYFDIDWAEAAEQQAAVQ
ncbi:hypothetical protein [Paenibacillus sp. y28]|uniref:hypothetical protein n=1 Tax=Paenibacillus sp. y28 TaxID=3129110 RepID=UPI00301A3E6F